PVGSPGVGKLHPADDAQVLQLLSIETRDPSIETRDPLPHWRWSVDENVQASSVSRRTMLKGVGAGAAIAWSTPILSSLRTPAFARTNTGVFPPCDPGETCAACNVAQACMGNSNCNCWLLADGSGCSCLFFVQF